MREKIIAMDCYNDLDNHVWIVNMDVYNVVMGYAYFIDPIKALLLYKATASDFSVNLYLRNKLKSVGGSEYDDAVDALGSLDGESTNPYCNVMDLHDVVEFINDDVIPALNELPDNTVVSSLWLLGDMDVDDYLRSLGGFMAAFNTDSKGKGSLDYFAHDIKSLFEDLVEDVFNESIAQNNIYEVIIY